MSRLRGDTRSSAKVKHPKPGANVSPFRGKAQQAPRGACNTACPRRCYTTEPKQEGEHRRRVAGNPPGPAARRRRNGRPAGKNRVEPACGASARCRVFFLFFCTNFFCLFLGGGARRAAVVGSSTALRAAKGRRSPPAGNSNVFTRRAPVPAARGCQRTIGPKRLRRPPFRGKRRVGGFPQVCVRVPRGCCRLPRAPNSSVPD
jgi:hypothetical protein